MLAEQTTQAHHAENDRPPDHHGARPSDLQEGVTTAAIDRRREGALQKLVAYVRYAHWLMTMRTDLAFHKHPLSLRSIHVQIHGLDATILMDTQQILMKDLRSSEN